MQKYMSWQSKRGTSVNSRVETSGDHLMETPLSPLDFLRRSRRLYPDREAVVDENLRLTYTEFGKRCDRWTAHFKVPKSFTFVTELPETATGKIQKYVLRSGKAAIAAQ
jgi:non-ribosomal peptide synthetase component E (peptide arylation enzyme)